jgi:hypothetical protein
MTTHHTAQANGIKQHYHCCVRKWVKPNIINGLVKSPVREKIL